MCCPLDIFWPLHLINTNFVQGLPSINRWSQVTCFKVKVKPVSSAQRVVHYIFESLAYLLRTGFALTEKINLNFAPWGALMFLKHFLFCLFSNFKFKHFLNCARRRKHPRNMTERVCCTTSLSAQLIESINRQCNALSLLITHFLVPRMAISYQHTCALIEEIKKRRFQRLLYFTNEH